MDKFSTRIVKTVATSLLVLLALGQLRPVGAAQSTKAGSKGAYVDSIAMVSRSLSQGKSEDGAKLLDRFDQAANSMQSYSFQYEMTVFKGTKTIQEKGNFYFKKPRLLRVEETGNFKNGSVAVVGPDGKVRGHLGGLLSKFTATVAADSDWVLSANGFPMVDSDLGSIARVMKQYLRNGMKAYATVAPVVVPNQSKAVYVLDLYKDASQSELVKRAYFDPDTFLPVEWFDHKDGHLFSRTIWYNIRQNANLDDKLFTL